MNPATGQVERSMVACGQCPTCQAGRKNDWAGRLIAEAKTAKDVYFLTLTYKNEPADYHYTDVQKMLKHLRTDLVRNHGGKGVRFFVVGERGNKFGRIHWHILLFFNARHHIARPPKNTLWQFWPHGWTQVAHVPTHDTIRRVRYCAKYAVKTIGDDRSCRLRCSLKPAIGGAFLRDFAEGIAEAGLPLRGYFTLPGLVWDRGRRSGDHVRYRLKGSSARTVSRVYCETWAKLRPHKPWPLSPFLSRYYPEQLMERMLLWPETKGPGLGKLPAEQPGRLSFATRESHFNHLNGVPVNVFETPAEQAEREALEGRIEDRRAAHAQFSAENGHLPALYFRINQVRSLGFSAEDPAFAHYVKTGDPSQTSIEDRWTLCGHIWLDGSGDDLHGRGCPVPQAASAESLALAETRFAEKARIWANRFDCEETVCDATGEVLIRPIPRSKGIKPEKPIPHDPIEYQPRSGGLAERAIRQSIGSQETRDIENAAREVSR